MMRHRILLIDDHDPIRYDLRCLFEAQGYLVQEADDGLDGVRKARAWKPHVAVVDIDLPLFDGYGVARQVRQSFGDTIRLIALSRWNSSRHPGRRSSGKVRLSRPQPTGIDRWDQILHRIVKWQAECDAIPRSRDAGLAWGEEGVEPGTRNVFHRR